MKLSIGLALLVAPALALAAEFFDSNTRLLPLPFIGTWGADQASCLDPASDPLSMRIENSRISIWGVSGHILVSPSKDLREIPVSVVFDGDGSRITTVRLRVSRDGMSITSMDPREMGVYRVKCKTQPASSPAKGPENAEPGS
jgi:hypothetical protein